MCFTHGKDIECPECPGMGKRNRKPLLTVAERNYSGCSVDYGYCEECGKAWCISYKVDKMVRSPEWDGLSRAEREEKEAERALEKAREKELEDKRMLSELMEKYPDYANGKEMIKQVIVMRKDLKMRRGKEIAQGSHASIAFLTRKIQRYLEDKHSFFLLSKVELDWINGIFTKICLKVNSEEELLEIDRKAKEAGLECHLITDAGLTEFNGVPTRTCLCIGPDESDKIDAITRDLELY